MHEVSHLTRRLKHSPESEAFHNAVAAELLIPTFELIKAIKDVGIDLRALKKHFRKPSMEAIARHIPGAVLNAFSGKWEGWAHAPQWRRVGERAELSEKATKIEWEAVSESYLKSRGRAYVARDGVWAYAWRVTNLTPHRAISVVVVE